MSDELDLDALAKLYEREFHGHNLDDAHGWITPETLGAILTALPRLIELARIGQARQLTDPIERLRDVLVTIRASARNFVPSTDNLHIIAQYADAALQDIGQTAQQRDHIAGSDEMVGGGE